MGDKVISSIASKIQFAMSTLLHAMEVKSTFTWNTGTGCLFSGSKYSIERQAIPHAASLVSKYVV